MEKQCDHERVNGRSGTTTTLQPIIAFNDVSREASSLASNFALGAITACLPQKATMARRNREIEGRASDPPPWRHFSANRLNEPVLGIQLQSQERTSTSPNATSRSARLAAVSKTPTRSTSLARSYVSRFSSNLYQIPCVVTSTFGPTFGLRTQAVLTTAEPETCLRLMRSASYSAHALKEAPK